MPPITITPDEVAAILAPFAGAKLTDRKSTDLRIDIAAGAFNMVDCDVRRVGAHGFERFFYSGCEAIAYERVRSIKVYRWSDDQRRMIVSAEYEVSAERLAA